METRTRLLTEKSLTVKKTINSDLRGKKKPVLEMDGTSYCPLTTIKLKVRTAI